MEGCSKDSQPSAQLASKSSRIPSAVISRRVMSLLVSPPQIVVFVSPQAKAAAGSNWELPQAQHNKQIVWLTTGKLGKAKLHFSCAVISVPWGM